MNVCRVKYLVIPFVGRCSIIIGTPWRSSSRWIRILWIHSELRIIRVTNRHTLANRNLWPFGVCSNGNYIDTLINFICNFKASHHPISRLRVYNSFKDIHLIFFAFWNWKQSLRLFFHRWMRLKFICFFMNLLLRSLTVQIVHLIIILAYRLNGVIFWLLHKIVKSVCTLKLI